MRSTKRKSRITGLVITRRVGEIITVNKGELLIEVLRCQGHAVKLKFQASKDIQIDRAEAPNFRSENATHKTDSGQGSSD